MGWAEQKKSLQTCLLLFLRDHGAEVDDLVERVRPLCEGTNDAARVWRVLRGLERQGLVRSNWHYNNVGPAECTYRITSKGLVRLAQRADVLASLDRQLHAFLELYARTAAAPASSHLVPSASMTRAR